MTIWEDCKGIEQITAISEKPWRVVEAQHISSSRDLVDDIEEHELLEQLLEDTKPDIDKQYNYLIFTPFRYPPLEYGSRFGQKHEKSLWYGSLDLPTAMAEVAYYRLKFFADTQADLGYIELPLTAFSVLLQTKKGIDLTTLPFNRFSDSISHKNSYLDSQTLGSDMRNAEIEAFIFFSARTSEMKKNIAAFTPNVFCKTNSGYINEQQNWRCHASKEAVEFSRQNLFCNEKMVFQKVDF
ncbi:RES family NAD+ phosphorylase [Legionella dresdenensis]|uniref:RES family NAD+ phosphorylase n=1 Tax=Legionella dresdenensis TaxID=450200 RepID=A0ABV8CC78_9GAMM